MNYLFHLYFCTREPEALIAACLGDCFKGNLDNLPYSAVFRKGLLLHRQLDSYTDSHPIILETKALFPQGMRRFSGIVLDILFDHLLAANWGDYSKSSLNEFTEYFYQLCQQAPKMPSAAERLLSLISTQDWLGAYADFNAVDYVLKRMNKRVSFPVALEESVGLIEANYPLFKNNFQRLMSEASVSVVNNQGQLF